MERLAILMVACMSLYACGYELPEYSTEYDPNRDVFADLDSALGKASDENKLLLIEPGGDWCIWCHRLDAFIESNDEVKERFFDVFVLLKVNVSEENMNEEFISQLPEIEAYPHFFIVDQDGQIVGEKNTGKLEVGESYSRSKFISFIHTWEEYRRFYKPAH